LVSSSKRQIIIETARWELFAVVIEPKRQDVSQWAATIIWAIIRQRAFGDDVCKEVGIHNAVVDL
jgi:hypothetical protein